MELQKVDPDGLLWLVTGGTIAAVGDVVRVPSLERVDDPGDSDAAAGVSPFEAEIVVDSLTRAVLLPSPFQDYASLLGDLEAAGLEAQAQIVREWSGLALRGKRSRRRAA